MDRLITILVNAIFFAFWYWLGCKAGEKKGSRSLSNINLRANLLASVVREYDREKEGRGELPMHTLAEWEAIMPGFTIVGSGEKITADDLLTLRKMKEGE